MPPAEVSQRSTANPWEELLLIGGGCGDSLASGRPNGKAGLRANDQRRIGEEAFRVVVARALCT
jgi:hypothetical protein